jgi:hypothetical protein
MSIVGNIECNGPPQVFGPPVRCHLNVVDKADADQRVARRLPLAAARQIHTLARNVEAAAIVAVFLLSLLCTTETRHDASQVCIDGTVACLLGRAKRSSPKAAQRRAAGAGLDGERAHRAKPQNPRPALLGSQDLPVCFSFDHLVGDRLQRQRYGEA